VDYTASLVDSEKIGFSYHCAVWRAKTKRRGREGEDEDGRKNDLLLREKEIRWSALKSRHLSREH
jgi:hypothetical protein